MGYAFELYFDAGSDEYFRSLWSRLDRLGFLSEDLRGDAGPHISLSVCEELDPEKAFEETEAFCTAHPPFDLRFGFLGTFISDANVIFAAPSFTTDLRMIHDDFHRRFRTIQKKVWGHYLPESWQPHCTLAIDIPKESFLEVFAEIRGAFRPVEVRVESLGIVEFRPVRQIHESMLREHPLRVQ